jgi:hypothetical protein
VIGAAARRFAVLFLTVGTGSLAVGSLIAWASGASPRRGATVSLYAVGALCTVIGAGIALRNSLQRGGPGGLTVERTETAADRELAGVLIVLGILLLVVGIAIDSRARLV